MPEISCYLCDRPAEGDTSAWRVLWPALLDGTPAGDGYALCPNCLADLETRNAKNPLVGAATTD